MQTKRRSAGQELLARNGFFRFADETGLAVWEAQLCNGGAGFRIGIHCQCSRWEAVGRPT